MELDRVALEQALGAVPGVASARVDDPPGSRSRDGAAGIELGTLVLTLTPGADEVAVANAVDLVLREQFGLGVDPARIDLVEESAPERRLRAVPPPLIRAVGVSDPSLGAAMALALVRPRLAIRRLQVVSSGLGVTATVTLAHDDLEVSGQSDGPTSAAGVLRAVAGATVTAVEDAVVAAADRRGAALGLPGGVAAAARLDLDAVELPVVGGGPVAVVQVSITTASGSERLTGASEVRDDVRQAVVRATLDALNRRLETLLDPR